jgi:hypothetical protein
MDRFDVCVDCAPRAQIASRVEFASLAHSDAADRKSGRRKLLW